MSNYKNLTDYLEMKSGKIFNLGFEIDVFIDKNYTTDYVIKTMIDKIQEYMDVETVPKGEFDLNEKLRFEKEYTGIYVSGHPLDEYPENKGEFNFDTSMLFVEKMLHT